MTIREYVHLHSKETFDSFWHSIAIKPFSLFGKSWKDEQEALVAVHKKLKENGAWKTELTFFSLKDLAKKVDFSIEPKKFHIGYDSMYSYDAQTRITFYIDDDLFIKISKSCNDM